ncbi:MAG: hypothetical protein FWG89_04645 [Treponema sp.]|nr:hypothetical protein [Treponema sp.]
MRNEVKLIGIITLIAVIVLSLAACNRGNSSSSAPAREESSTSTSLEELMSVIEEITPVIEESTTTTSSSGTDWDALLADFDRLVDDYIAILRAQQTGDLTAVTRAASALQNANRVMTQLENASSDLTPAQMQRLQSISAKMADAAMSVF